MRFTGFGIAIASLLAGCGGADRSICASCDLQPVAALSAHPPAIQFPNQQGTQSVSVTINGGIPPYTAIAADARYVNVSSQGATSDSFTITPVAGGTTSVIVHDRVGGSTSISVTVDVCVPPSPEFFQVYPAPAATAVPSTVSSFWAAVPTTDPGASTAGAYRSRLIAGDGTVLSGDNFKQTTASPPPASNIPPSSSSGYTYTYDYFTSSISGLQPATTYKVQVFDPGYTCIPPLMLGQFST